MLKFCVYYDFYIIGLNKTQNQVHIVLDENTKFKDKITMVFRSSIIRFYIGEISVSKGKEACHLFLVAFTTKCATFQHI